MKIIENFLQFKIKHRPKVYVRTKHKIVRLASVSTFRASVHIRILNLTSSGIGSFYDSEYWKRTDKINALPSTETEKTELLNYAN